MSNAYGPCASSDDVLQFIEDFVHQGPEFSMKSVFSHGGCYWFARVLCDCFDTNEYGCFLMYSPVLNHFAAFIETEQFNGQVQSSVFDITGRIELAPEEHWVSWTKYKHKDPFDALRVLHNCVQLQGDWMSDPEMTEEEAVERLRKYNRFTS